MKLLVPNARIAFPSLFEASSFEGDGKAKFSVKSPIAPDALIVKTIDNVIDAVAREKWGVKADKILASLDRTSRKAEVFFVRRPYTSKDGDVYAGFEDMFTLSASSETRPLIIDRDKSPLVQSDGRPYAGCYCNLSLEIWAQDNKWGRGIRATLKGVQFVKDGDAFSGGTPASPDDFDDLSETESENEFA